jgi:hypothetical protein
MKRILAVAIVIVLAVPLVSLAQTCDSQTCGDSLPPQSPYSRGYLEFIELTYEGAYGRSASCFELRNEYFRLVNAAAGGTLNAEARRFVATRFMTQTSYNDPSLSNYVQTTEYNAINPSTNGDRASLESFIADLYRAFLQREPDAGGQCFWTNDACAVGRKHPIRAFEESIEFGNLVNGLYDDGPAPTCHFGE